MNLFGGFLGDKISEWTSSLAPGTQLSRRSFASVSYTPKGATEGTDISEDLMQYLKSIEYTDNLADAVDDLTLTLEDKATLWQADWFPDTGAKLRVILNTYNNQNLGEGLKQLDLGEFEVDQIEISAMPSVVQVKAVACTGDNTLRGEKQNQEWKETTVSVIVNDIAAKNGLTMTWLCDEDPAVDHVEQSDQSDLEFVRKLCKDNGYNLKVTSEKMIVYDEKQMESEEPKLTFLRPGSPAAMQIYVVHAASTASTASTAQEAAKLDTFFSYKMTAKTRDIYKACHVKYKEKKSDTVIESTFEDPSKTDGKTLEVNTQVKTQEEADRLARKKLREQNKDEVTASFTVGGDFIFWAGEVVELSKFGHFDGKYIITKAAHHMGSGYTVDLDMRRCLDGY